MARLAGWNLVSLTAISIGVCSVAWLARQGVEEESVRLLIRATARTSFGLFLLAFCASSLRSLVRKDWSSWLLRNRRYLGVSFGVSHTDHLAFIFAMAASSSDTMRKRLGSHRWHRLHLIGSYLSFSIFLGSYLPRAMKNAAYIPNVILLTAAVGLRLTRSLRVRSAQVT